MPGHIWIDGRIMPAEGAHLSAFDRGFQLGDGIFETLRARGGRVTELREHLTRLQRSAAGLDIKLPVGTGTQIARGIASLLEMEGLAGPGGRRVDPRDGESRRVHGSRAAASVDRDSHRRS